MEHQIKFKSIDLENDREIIYYKTLENKINLYEDLIKYGKILSILSILIFFAIVTLNFSFSFNLSWLLLLIPGLIAILAVTSVINLYLRVEEIIDSLEKKDINIGTIISYFCVNLVSISLIAYLILLCLKINKVINCHFSLISIPLYLLLGVSFFYLVFIFPALIQSQMYIEIIVILSYIFNFFLFLIMMNFRFDSLKATLEYKIIFIPVWIALSIHLILISYSTIIKEESVLKHLFFYCFISTSLAATICISFKFDSKKNIPEWIIFFMSLIGLISCILEFFIHYIIRLDDRETTN